MRKIINIIGLTLIFASLLAIIGSIYYLIFTTRMYGVLKIVLASVLTLIIGGAITLESLKPHRNEK